MDEPQSIELVYIQTNCLAVTVKGAASLPSFSEKEARFAVCCDEPFELQLAGEAEELSLRTLAHSVTGQYRLRPIFFEQQQYEIVIEPTEGHTVEFWHENYNVRKSVSPVGHRSGVLSGVIDFGNDIGFSDIVLPVDGREHLKLTVEVFPSRISYKDDYKAIMADITEEVYGLIFDFLRKTYRPFGSSPDRRSTPTEFFAVIGNIYDRFISASDKIISNPHHILKTEHRLVPGYKIRRTDKSTIRWIEKHPEQAMLSGDTLIVSKAPAVEKRVTYDTAENRLAKHMLLSTAKTLEAFKTGYAQLSGSPDDKVISECERMTGGIRRRASTGVFRQVESAAETPGMSLVFGMAPGYRELYRCYLLLQHGLSVTGSVFRASVKELSVLYEYWCFIKLNSLMRERYRLISQDVIRVDGNGLCVSLRKGQSSRVRYLDPDSGEIITLSYAPDEPAVSSSAARANNYLLLEKKGVSLDYDCVFRVRYEDREILLPTVPAESGAADKRHRDTIVYRNSAAPYSRTLYGSFVLFPSRVDEGHGRHHFFASAEQVNVGALPFLPSETRLVSALLDELISDSPTSEFEGAALPADVEEQLARVDWSRRDVLIGSLRSRDQLNVCMENNFYYIPVKRVPDASLPIHYVALFQTPRVFSSDAGIYCCGEVLTASIVKRRNIREVPMRRSADPEELYYRFQIKKWVRLKRPIKPKESAFVCEFTNLFLLRNSEYVQELLIRSKDEFRFYAELKRRTRDAVIIDDETASGFEYNGTKILFDDGQIKLIRSDELIEARSISEFAKRPSAVFRRLMSIAENGNIKQP